ncbi:MAG: hypothetical protein QOI24_4020 [Acidobacteriota bacterium]|nr:hypothetical protein [Acidobacteriota bacterium]
MRIAILGAGNTGTCAALELAGRGHHVDLYDQSDAPVRMASFHNEGKVHVGILYAKDRSLRTAELMIRGALAFAPLLDRWVGFDSSRLQISTPFHYGVHNGTMVSMDELKAHYAKCQRLFHDLHVASGQRYLGVDQSLQIEELNASEMDSLVSREYFVAMFRTSERAVDPRTVAALLREAALANPRIHGVWGARISAVNIIDGGRLAVSFRKDGEDYVEAYDQVANTLWHGRLSIDATMGLGQEHPWMYRYKFANRVLVPIDGEIPSITCVLGPFGDIVNYGTNGLFLSWYPEGMIATSRALEPPDWESELTPERRHEVFRRSYEAWMERCPPLRALRFRPSDADPGGGIIFAWGDTGVDDPESMLHERFEIGVHSYGNYHTVNTGKYTMTPWMGMKTAERILGVS